MKKEKRKIANTLFVAVSTVLFFGMAAQVAQAGSAVLTWDASREPDLAGYKIYYDTSSHSGSCPAGYGSNVINVGNVTTYAVGENPDDPNLQLGQTYYFSVTAYDNATPPNESSCSSEVSVSISAPTITNISSNKADGAYGISEVIDIDVTFSEAVTSTGNVTITLETGSNDRTCTFAISNSTAGTCDYTVESGDASADLTVSNIAGTIRDQGRNILTNFSPTVNLAANKNLIIDTSGAEVDIDAPVLSGGSPSGALSSGTKNVNLAVTTNENATCKYAAAAGIAYAQMSSSFSSTGGTSHSTVVSSLEKGKSYSYYVRCQDASLNANASDNTVSFSVKKSSGSNSGSSSKKKKSSKRKIFTSPKQVSRGMVIVQSGKKFTKNGLVRLYFSRPQGGYYPPKTVKAGSSGAFSLVYRINKASGFYTWYAIDVTTGKRSKNSSYTVR